MSGWFIYQESGDPVGPLPTETIAQALVDGKVGRDAFVAAEGDPQWQPITRVAAIVTATRKLQHAGLAASAPPRPAPIRTVPPAPPPAAHATPPRVRVPKLAAMTLAVYPAPPPEPSVPAPPPPSTRSAPPPPRSVPPAPAQPSILTPPPVMPAEPEPTKGATSAQPAAPASSQPEHAAAVASGSEPAFAPVAPGSEPAFAPVAADGPPIFALPVASLESPAAPEVDTIEEQPVASAVGLLAPAQPFPIYEPPAPARAASRGGMMWVIPAVVMLLALVVGAAGIGMWLLRR